jgi:hypothetical protein
MSALQIPDGSPAALRCYGPIGEPEALSKSIESIGVGNTADLIGVDKHTLRMWRYRLGLPVFQSEVNKQAKPLDPKTCEQCGGLFASPHGRRPSEFKVRRFCGKSCASRHQANLKR